MQFGRVLMALLLVALVPYVAQAREVQATKEWTVMVFLNGDNNLDSAGVDDVNEMEKVGSSDQVSIIVQHDREGNSGTKRYYIQKDTNAGAITSPVIQDMPECDMGNWEEALKFFKWGVDNYPAKRYLFAVWNHGAGWEGRTARDVLLKGISYDDQSGNHIKTTQLRLLTKACSEYIGRKLDIISYDACLMQMAEVANEVKEYALVQVGAEETEPGDGWPYDDFLAPLVTKPAMEARELGQIMVEKYVASYNGGSQGTRNTCLSAIDLQKMDEFNAKLNAYADALIANAGQNAKILETISATQAYAYAQYKDLLDFTQKLLPKLDVPEIQATGSALVKFVKEQLVIKNGYVGSSLAGSFGVSIYLPTKSQFDSMRQEYAQLEMAKNGTWDEFLQGLFYPNVPVIKVKEVLCEDDNGAVNPGDEVTVKVKLSNEGMKDSTALTVSLAITGGQASPIGEPVVVDKVPGMSTVAAPPLKVKISDSCPVDTQIPVTVKATDAAGKVFTGEAKIAVKQAFVVKNKVLLVVLDKADKFTPLYTKALNDAGVAFDLYDVKYYGPASAGLFKNYVAGTVIFNAPGTNDVGAVSTDDLAGYLDRGGSLFITGQDVGYKIKDTPFYKDYLHAKFVQDNTGIKEVLGQGVLNGVAAKIEGGDGANNQQWPDEIDPIAPAVSILQYKHAKHESVDMGYTGRTDTTRGVQSTGTAGLAVAAGTYKVVYFACGFEAFATADARKTVMAKVLDYLKPTASDRVRGLKALSERTARLDASRGSAAYQTARNDEAEFVKNAAELLRADPAALTGITGTLGRDLRRAVNFDTLKH